MKTAVIYARYSSDRQTEQSIEGQLRVCNEYAKRNDIIIVHNYIDRAMTGTNDNREDFQRMLKDSDQKAWDYVLVYKLDRFSRNKYEMAIHRKHLKDNGIKILSAMENIPDSPEGILLESLLEGMNQYYSEELSQKTKRGLHETRLKGNFYGGVLLYGYARNENKIVINEEEAMVVRELFSKYNAGMRVRTIIKDFTSRGIYHRDKPFRQDFIYLMLRSEKYTGICTIGGKVYDNIYPQIISPEIFAATRQKTENCKRGKYTDGVEYLLKDIAYCGYCGCKLYSYAGTSATGKIYRYYWDQGKADKHCKRLHCWRKDDIESLVIKELTNILNEEKIRSRIIDKIMEKQVELASDNTDVTILTKALNGIDKSLKNLLSAIEAGIFSDTTNARLHELEKQRKDTEYKLLEAKGRTISVIPREQIEKRFTEALKQKPRAMLELLVDKIIVYNDKLKIILKYTDKPKRRQYKTDKTPDGSNPDRELVFIMQQTTKCKRLLHSTSTSSEHRGSVNLDILIQTFI